MSLSTTEIQSGYENEKLVVLVKNKKGAYILDSRQIKEDFFLDFVNGK